MKGLFIIILIIAAAVAAWPQVAERIPARWNPFAPLAVTDPPTLLTRFKMKKIASDPAACLAVLRQAASGGWVTFTQPTPVQGKCPLPAPVRIQRFGDVTLSSSFLASCPLAVAATRYVIQLNRHLAQNTPVTALTRIDHVGSYACRNIYHRREGRLSEHATADAWDVTAFRLRNGQRLSVLHNWQQPPEKALLLQQFFTDSCDLFGNALGPNYNTAHASHFHFGMRGFGVCR